MAKIVEYIHSYSILIPETLEKHEIKRLEEFEKNSLYFTEKPVNLSVQLMT